MVTDIFFDLQRFADDTLKNDGTAFEWAGGHRFEGSGTQADPAYMTKSNSGADKINGTAIYLTGDGTSAGYTMAIEEVKNDWEVNVTDAATINSDFSAGSRAYGISGNANVIVKGGSTEGFTETVNGQPVFVKAATSDVTVNVAPEGTAMTYTFENSVDGVGVGLDSDDKAIFTSGATNASFAASAEETATLSNRIGFANAVTVTSNGTNVNVESGDNTFDFDDGDTLAVKVAEGTNVTYSSSGALTGVTKDATLTTSDGIKASDNFSVNGVAWNQISGTMTGIVFDSLGAAGVAGNDAVTVTGNAGNIVVLENLTTTGVTANGKKVQAVNTASTAVGLALAEEGISVLTVDNEDSAIKVYDDSFVVSNGGASYVLASTADYVIVDGDRTTANLTVKADNSYAVTGVDAYYSIENGINAAATAVTTLDGATVSIKNNNALNEYVLIQSKTSTEGINTIYNLNPNDVVNVTNDSDGYTAIFQAATTTNDVTLTTNSAKVSVNGAFMDAAAVQVDVAASGSEVTVRGIEGGAVITLEGGATYHIKDAQEDNEVIVAAGDTVNVSLDSAGNVYEQLSADAQKRADADAAKWAEVASIGGTADTDGTHHGKVYEDFYALNSSGVSSNTLAGYNYDNDTAPTNATAAIDIRGESPKGTAYAIGDAAHVTLAVNTPGTYVGAVPVNIQKNENGNVVDVVVNLAASNNPATVAIGTEGTETVTASHEVYLPNSATKASYAYVGEFANGQNKIIAGSTGAMMRHDGSARASILGGTGNDTIRAARNDYVAGGIGAADYFYDSASYTISDYTVSEGDAIVAMKLGSLDEVTIDNLRGTGNQIGIGPGRRTLTIGNVDANSALHVKVAVMDDDANVITNSVRDVVLANGNGLVDATAADTNGALIVANSKRGDAVHQVLGSAGADDIYIGSYDYVDGAGGNDSIVIESGSGAAGVALTAGNDTVSGWVFGFDPYATTGGATKLFVGDAAFTGRVFEDRLLISVDGGASMTFDDTALAGEKHGQYDVLINTASGDKKYTALRYIPGTETYISVDSNDEVANYYIAEQEGRVVFNSGVTDDLGWIYLDDSQKGTVIETFQTVRNLTLNNNSHASVVGSSNRETVSVGGDYEASAGKAVSLAGENDVIISDGETGAGHTFYFGAGDGRDSIQSFNHYISSTDPDVQNADTLVFASGITGIRVDSYSDGDRVVFNSTADDDVVIYETGGVNENNMYRVKIGNLDTKTAKIGKSTTANNFTYDSSVSYYVGSSGEARDTLTIGDTEENVWLWLDGSQNGGEFYRGIKDVDASAATNTNISVAGGAQDNTIIAGGAGTQNFLWGGAGDNFLQGGAGKDFFLYYKNSAAYINGAAGQTEGNHDVVSGYDAENDIIYLGDVTIADINTAAMAQSGNLGIGEAAVTVEFNNGGSLSVLGTSNTRFYMSDGSAYSADRESGKWTKDA